jgi:threonine/homoserine/homoserine lactone efflux protein
MGAVIGDLLPLAVGIAISPVPIIAVILMLLSDKAAANGTGFLLGWVAGVVVVTVIVLALVGQVGDTAGGEPSTLSSVLKLVFGALLLLMSFRQWQDRPRAGEAGSMPKWMGAIESFTFGRALGLGFVLSGINPKNLLLCLGAGTTIGAAHLPAGEVVVAMVVFTVLASSTVGVPVIGYLAARDRMAAPLERLRSWLTQNNAAVMAVLLLVLGVGLIGKGIPDFERITRCR